MNKNNVQFAMDAANEIADSFSPGFFDGRMVEDVAAIIAKHSKNYPALLVREVITAAYDEIQYATTYAIANEIRESLNKQFGVK